MKPIFLPFQFLLERILLKIRCPTGINIPKPLVLFPLTGVSDWTLTLHPNLSDAYRRSIYTLPKYGNNPVNQGINLVVFYNENISECPSLSNASFDKMFYQASLFEHTRFSLCHEYEKYQELGLSMEDAIAFSKGECWKDFYGVQSMTCMQNFNPKVHPWIIEWRLAYYTSIPYHKMTSHEVNSYLALRHVLAITNPSTYADIYRD